MVPSARQKFEARYHDELFLADELLSRGGASSPEDHIWLDRLIAAYEASGDAEYDSCQDIPDPWALDTQPEVFEMTELPARGSSSDPLPDDFSFVNDDGPTAQAKKLRGEAARVRRELRPAVAAPRRERERIRRVVGGVWDVIRSLWRGSKSCPRRTRADRRLRR
jgi:hypothetical protein